MKRGLLIFAAAVALSIPRPAAAQDPPPPPCVVELQTYGYIATQTCQMFWLQIEQQTSMLQLMMQLYGFWGQFIY